MPATEDHNRVDQPMTFRGKDGRVYKTETMELNARGASEHQAASERKTWFGSFLRWPD